MIKPNTFAEACYWGHSVIKPNTFAEACYDTNTIQELEVKLEGAPDADDCDNWGISDVEWIYQIGLALEALLEESV